MRKKIRMHSHTCPTCHRVLQCSNVQPCPIPKRVECEICAKGAEAPYLGECPFEIHPLRCECGAYIGEEGTCKDIAICRKCRELEESQVPGVFIPAEHDQIISPTGGYRERMFSTDIKR